MLRFLPILFLVGFSYQAAAQLSVSVSSSEGRPGNCPYADGSIAVTAKKTNATGTVTLVIACAPNANDEKDKRYSRDVNFDKGEATSGPITLADDKPDEYKKKPMTKGDHCTVKASIGEYNDAPNTNKATAEFKVGYKQIGSPEAEVTGGAATVGKEFSIGNLHYTTKGIYFFDLVLRECTASNDPWIFWHEDNGTALHRVYPTSTTTKQKIKVNTPNNPDTCLGAYAGKLQNLVTIGGDHAGCKLKLVKDAVTHDTFTAQGAPTLAADAAVTTAGGKVMVHTGAKPDAPSNLSDTIAVYISTNRGFTWTISTAITAWTSSPADSSKDATMDNTRHMAMIKITAGDDTYWRLIKGQ